VKIKILHILNSLQIGGLENGVVNLINLLDHGRFEHSICCITSSGPMAERLTKFVKVYTLNKGNNRDYLLALKIKRIIDEIKPHIVHTRNWSAIDGVLGAKLAGVKFVIHGEHGREATDPTGKNIIRKKIRRILSPWISRFITVSAELKNWLINDIGVREEKIIQIINGVDTEKFKPGTDKKLSKSRIGMEPDCFVIGTVGRLDPVKDIQTLIMSFSYFAAYTQKSNTRDKRKLLIIGSGPEEQRLKTLVEELDIADSVYFLGTCTNIPELMQSLDVFVLPSIAEGVSNTVLEAMASGLPVIATKVGGNLELVADGKTGFLFSPGDYRSLAEKISFYFNNHSLLKEHGFNGRVRTENEFSLPVMVRGYEEIYTSLSPHTLRN
jgi:sugar transferase (PEP-CTERM/EpsH1 system associated)